MSTEVIAIRLLTAIAIRAVGYERKYNNRPNRFIYILVCVGAAVISMIQANLINNILELSTNPNSVAGIKTDLGRLGAQVISGIGF